MSELQLPIGRYLDCMFGPFVPRLRLVTLERLELIIPAADGPAVQEVDVAPVWLRGGLLMLSWIERDGTVVVHVHDYERLEVQSHARLPDGTLVRSAGQLRWVLA
jgi:hypothetical protein